MEHAKLFFIFHAIPKPSILGISGMLFLFHGKTPEVSSEIGVWAFLGGVKGEQGMGCKDGILEGRWDPESGSQRIEFSSYIFEYS